nr:Uncharacterised protein [Klebsiella pneumoniae]
MQADAPLKPTVNGQLSAVNMEKQQVAQIMRNGEVSPPRRASAHSRHPIAMPIPLLYGERDCFRQNSTLTTLPFRRELGCES